MDHLQQRTSFLDIFHLESNYPVFSRICDFLPIASILNLTQTSKSLANLYRVLLPYQWNINRSLHRFVNQPAGLRSQLGKCTALISGSFALQFFERVFWDESDLDIFVQDGRGSGELGLYLAEEEGYVLDSTKGRDRRDYIQPDIVEVSAKKPDFDRYPSSNVRLPDMDAPKERPSHRQRARSPAHPYPRTPSPSNPARLLRNYCSQFSKLEQSLCYLSHPHVLRPQRVYAPRPSRIQREPRLEIPI